MRPNGRPPPPGLDLIDQSLNSAPARGWLFRDRAKDQKILKYKDQQAPMSPL
jgi:hypothetical protein